MSAITINDLMDHRLVKLHGSDGTLGGAVVEDSVGVWIGSRRTRLGESEPPFGAGPYISNLLRIGSGGRKIAL